MAWDFNDIAGYFRQYAGVDGLSGAAGFFEWSAADGFDLSNYPPVRLNIAPTEDAPANQVARVWVKINDGAWQQLSDLAQVTNIGIGTVDGFQSGIQSMIVIRGWGAKSVGFGYILGIDTTLEQIQTDQTQGLLLVRGDIATDGTITPVINPDTPFIQGDLDDINTWMGAHGVTPSEFATKMGWASPAEGQTWMLANARKAFLQSVHDQWD
jgi:hypothetical protein